MERKYHIPFNVIGHILNIISALLLIYIFVLLIYYPATVGVKAAQFKIKYDSVLIHHSKYYGTNQNSY